MAHPEYLIAPMREDLTRFGVEETRTPEEVDQMLAPGSGTVLMVINSVCGCAAGKARPAVGMAMQHAVKPNRFATVFAAGDDEAVAHLRSTRLAQFPPSSPSIALFQDGQPVYMMHRHEIEQRQAPEIAQMLIEVFEQHCAPVS